MEKVALLLSACALALGGAALAFTRGSQHPPQTKAASATPAAALAKQPEAPEIGDWMRPLQLHAAKLWFAGHHANWKLAAFQLEEIDELMEEVTRHKIKEGGVDLGGTMDSIRQTQIKALEQAVKRADAAAFVKHYDELLRGCNDCHLRSGHDYIQIIRPLRPPIGNQRFEPPAK